MACAANRWPPVYDFESLESEIKNLIDKGLRKDFYKEDLNKEDIFQGDIFELKLPFPSIDEEGNVIGDDTTLWLVLGNTCDLARENPNYTNIIPLKVIPKDTPEDIIKKLKAYKSYKTIFFPSISIKEHGYIADFRTTCSININFLKSNAKKILELEYSSWVLFHSCIIRYFARDDGRHD